MFSRKLLSRVHRKMLIATCAGGALMQAGLSGCDQNLRDTLLSGVNASINGLITTVINAFFQALMSDSASSQSVVQGILNHLPTLA